MKLSACKKKKHFGRYYKLNIKSVNYESPFPRCIVIDLDRDDLLSLAGFCIALARGLPEDSTIDKLKQIIKDHEVYKSEEEEG